MNLVRIPKRLFLYWGRNKKLSYLRYLTVKSFMRLNPDWEVIVYYPKNASYKEGWVTGEQKNYNYKGRDCFDLLAGIHSKLSLKQFDFQAEMGVNEDTPEVIKSDILRLYLLHKEGGVWSDFDILYINPMSELDVDSNNKRAYVCDNGKYFSIGFLMGAVENRLYRVLYHKARTLLSYEPSVIDYQIVGSKLFKEYIDADSEIGNILPEAVYPVAYNNVQDLFRSTFALLDLSSSIGVHWFGGNKFSSCMDNTLSYRNIESFEVSHMKTLVEREMYAAEQPA